MIGQCNADFALMVGLRLWVVSVKLFFMSNSFSHWLASLNLLVSFWLVSWKFGVLCLSRSIQSFFFCLVVLKLYLNRLKFSVSVALSLVCYILHLRSISYRSVWRCFLIGLFKGPLSLVNSKPLFLWWI